MQPVLAARAIDITYTDEVAALNEKTLAGYNGLLIYANTTKIALEQEQALLDFVAGGKGFIPCTVLLTVFSIHPGIPTSSVPNSCITTPASSARPSGNPIVPS